MLFSVPFGRKQTWCRSRLQLIRNWCLKYPSLPLELTWMRITEIPGVSWRNFTIILTLPKKTIHLVAITNQNFGNLSIRLFALILTIQYSCTYSYFTDRSKFEIFLREITSEITNQWKNFLNKFNTTELQNFR